MNSAEKYNNHPASHTLMASIISVRWLLSFAFSVKDDGAFAAVGKKIPLYLPRCGWHVGGDSDGPEVH